MTLATTTRAYNDPELRARVDAAVFEEALARQDTSAYARSVLTNTAGTLVPFYWRVATDYDAAYEAALAAGRGAPGHDVDVITDGNIGAAVAAAWPVDPEPVA
jgi:hypothetical protein